MMRPLRKSVAATNVTPKALPVRSCSVRVVRRSETTSVSSTQVALSKVNNTSQSSWRNTSTPVHQEERKFRGPLKKRPITELTQATPAKSSAKRDVANKSTSRTPVTQLVAGRARRAIKPNRKYTSEDMVTPRILKTVTSGSKDADDDDDDNSMDDFFNRESSDEGNTYLDDLLDKSMNDSDKEFTEYEALNLDNSKSTRSTSTTPATAAGSAPRKRGRPRLKPLDSSLDTSVVSTKATTTVKNELLTKSLPVAAKRAADKLHTEMVVTRKRFVYSTDANKLKTTTMTRSSTTATAISAKPRVTPINKTTSYRLKEILDEALGSDMEEIEDEGTLAAAAQASSVQETPKPKEQQENLTLTDAKVNATKVVIKKSPPVLRTRLQMEQHATNNKVEIETPEANNNNKKSNENLMPTFTIVNINDIISKKGDALITKSSANSLENVANGGQQRILKKVTKAHTILNHQLANRQLAVKPTSTPAANKQAPRILNAFVSKKTQPVKPTTQNPDDSAESVTLSLDEDEETDNEVNQTFCSIGTDLSLTEAEEYSGDEQLSTPNSSRKRIFPVRGEAMKHFASIKRQDTSSSSNSLPEQVEITRQGNKIIQRITCLENWYVIARKNATSPPPQMLRNQFDMPLIELANTATALQLPSDQWSSKVTLFELPAATLAKGNYTTYTGSLTEHNISEEERDKYQPSCVMFRRAAVPKEKSRLPYDRAVIFKNNTFYTNMDGKNVRLLGAPNIIDKQEDVEIMLDIMDTLSLQSSIVETTGSI